MDELGRFRERLKQLRVEKKMTQKELGEALGIRNSVVSFYEVGQREPSLEMIIKIAEYFHVTTDYLLGVDDDRGGLDTSMLNEDEISVLNSLVEVMRKN